MRWRNTRDYRIWRVRVIRRDRRCVICGSIKDRQAHHLNHASYFPEQRYDTKNGICLCRDCHINFHTNFKRSFREKCTKNDFENFLILVKKLKERICDV